MVGLVVETPSLVKCLHPISLSLSLSHSRYRTWLCKGGNVETRRAAGLCVFPCVQVIKDVRPDVVAVELCRHRGKEVLSSEVHKSITLKEFLKMKGGWTDKILTYLINELYAHLATKGLKPGEEMRVALEEGMALNAAILYMDQDMDVTMKRAAEGFSLMAVLRLILRRKQVLRQCPALARAIRNIEPDEEDFTGLVEALMHPEARAEAIWVGETYFPGLFNSLVHERNEHMVTRLRSLSGKIVGVVGALHLQGMQKLWQDAEDVPHRTNIPLPHTA